VNFPLIMFWTFSVLPFAITVSIPASVAIFAAFNFDCIPPAPSDDFVLPQSCIVWPFIFSTFVISFASLLDGSLSQSPSTVVRMMYRSALMRIAVYAPRMSLSPNVSSSVDMTSFSLIIGTMPASRSFSRTSFMLLELSLFEKSALVRRAWATLILCFSRYFE